MRFASRDWLGAGLYCNNELTLAALRMALELRRPSAGWVHHSDRGGQYASGDYTDVLKAHGCEISMSHKASPGKMAAASG